MAAKVDEHVPRTADRLGFRRTVDHSYGDLLFTTTTYYFLTAAWAGEVFKGMNPRNVNRELVARGILLPGKDSKASQAVALPGMGTTRAYVVSNAALFSDPEAAEAA